ncbi:nuclease-related domain-containing protein [Fundicoccus culcitae]|uniref:NERD domain-containing protein n=1 Tax=Fundicoccus culcitae TaxID=2969821 RepID=A0ABY5P951_9LACT|nr:nuclease-related domain-containing protein [Fundicoccus culcitae]UUX35116.1 NERD domain-containing protein [Fundicoccus culcitae]
MEKNVELRVLEALAVRGVPVDEAALSNLRAGYEGEQKFARAVVEFGLSHLMWVEDYWFKVGNGPKRQPDFLLILPYEWVAIDVKNYQSRFEYREGKCYLNGGTTPMDNIVVAAQNRNQSLQKVAREVAGNISVRSALVFINENCHVYQDDMPCDVELVPRTLLKPFLEQYLGTGVVKDWLRDRTLSVLDKYQTEYGFEVKGLRVEQFGELRRGIVCGGCGQYGLVKNKLHIHCPHCGAEEATGDVVKRHALQLRLVFYDNPEMVTIKNVYELMGGGITQRTVRTYMYKQFKVVNKARASYYDIDLSAKKSVTLLSDGISSV